MLSPRLMLIGAGCLMVLSVLAFIRMDAIRDERLRAKAESDAARLIHINEANKDANEIRDLGDTALCDELGRLLQGGCPD